MRFRTCSALLLLLLVSACATDEGARNMRDRIANLKRAAALPWTDHGRCAVKEASNEWPVLAERCYSALELHRIRFQDLTGRCSVASTDAATMGMVGVCVLAAPEIVVGAVIISGAVVVAVLIKEALDDENARVSQTQPPQQERSANGSPKPEGLGRDWLPPPPPESPEPEERRPECTPRPVPPKGGNGFHNICADNVPLNAFRGFNALVNGKSFDALQTATRTLWEVKTTAIETYNPYVQRMELDNQVREGRREKALAEECGYHFVIGVRTEAHKLMLKDVAPDLTVVLMPWC